MANVVASLGHRDEDDSESRMQALLETHRNEIVASVKRLLLRSASHNSADSARSATAFEIVKSYFESNGNRPATTSEILSATKIKRSSLSNLLYQTYKNFFVAVSTLDSKRTKWTLKQTATSKQDMAKKPAHVCCRIILMERGNTPTHALTLAKIAISRGYRGRGKLAGDALEFVVAKSFWARLSRDNVTDFEQTSHMFFRVRNPDDPKRTTGKLWDEDEDEKKPPD